ncbi:MAG: hypothetical protein AAGB48_12575 [Planctomycetota bacterium]
MPARRSRTENWSESLWQLCARGGPIEISVLAQGAKSLVWRVRLLQIDDGDLIVEQPVTLRRAVPMQAATPLVGAIAIGQNRWMFLTSVRATETRFVRGRDTEVLRLSEPHAVERCQRRSFYRISTVALDLPSVGCWALPEPDAAVPLEMATRAALADAAGASNGAVPDPGELAMPTVGRGTDAALLNLGGGGACVTVSPEHASVLDRVGAFLLKLDLTPSVPLALPITARVAHTKVDSSQNVQAGFAFDFSMHREYESFIAEQICRYVVGLQAGGTKAAA